MPQKSPRTKVSIFLLLLLSLSFSCGKSEKESTRAENLEEIDSTGFFLVLENGDTLESAIPIPTSGTEIALDTMPEAKVIKINELPKHQLASNIAYDITLSAQALGETEIRTPGQDTLDLPTDTTFTPTFQAVKFSEPIQALNPKYKDAAIFDLQFWDVDQNFAESYTHCVYEDRRGDIWIGTEGSGAIRYDGTTFQKFSVEEGLSSEFVRCIMEDSEGNMWFGTSGGGVCKFNGDSIMSITSEQGLKFDKVVSIIEASDGKMWFGIYGGGVASFDGNTLTSYTIEQGLSSDITRQVSEDDKGNIWIGSRDGLQKFDGESFELFSTTSGLAHNIVWTVEPFGDELWLGTGKGINIIKGDSIYTFADGIGALSSLAESIIKDEEGNIWIASRSSGLIKYDGKKAELFRKEEGIPEPNLTDVSQGSSGELWMSYWGTGFGKFDPNSFNHLTTDQGLKDHKAFAVDIDHEGRTWLATTKGLQILDGNDIYDLTMSEGLPFDRLYGLMVDDEGNVWIGVHSFGILIWNGSELKPINTEQGLTSGIIRCFLQDQNGDVWAGTYAGGVNRITDTTITTYVEEDGLASFYILSMVEEKDGDIWLSGSNGVSKYDGKSFTNYSMREGLADMTVWCSFIDNKENVWFGTSNGLSIFDGENFTNFFEEDGLAYNVVRSIEQDDKGRVWVITDGGISIFDYKDDSSNELDFNIYAYGKQDGLKGLSNYLGSTVISEENNELWIGSGSGVSRVNLDDFELNTAAPSVKLTRIDINQKFIDFRSEKSGTSTEAVLDEATVASYKEVEDYYNIPDALTLKANKNHLTFWFGGKDWSANHKVAFRYKLDGLDEDWSDVTTEYRADYRNIPHGKYTFQVQAKGESLEWGEIDSFEFEILPPWYHTWWARMAYIIAAILLLLGFNKIRTRKLVQRQKELESTVEERTAEVVEQKKAVEAQKVEIEQQHLQLEESHKEITDSISYAKRIQEAILPSEDQFKEHLPDSFVYYEPKNIVAGDFYWLYQKDDLILFGVADCTGHGVPGAMVSVVCNNALDRSVGEFGLTEPSEILDKTRAIVIASFEDKKNEVKDGMDIALCAYNTKTNKLSFSGAHNNLYLIRKGELEVIKANRQPIGKFEGAAAFDQHEFDITTGDQLYIFTDGFADQFGGEKGKKMKYKTFKDLIYLNKDENMNGQLKKLKTAFENWKGDFEQVDDVCVIGIRF